MSTLKDALVRLDAASADPREAAVAVLEALAVTRGPDVRPDDVLWRVLEVVGDRDFAVPVLDVMFRSREPQLFLTLARRYVGNTAFEAAVIGALGDDDDVAAAGLEVQYEAWGYGAFTLSDAGARQVAAAVAELRIRPEPSKRLASALRRYAHPKPSALRP